MLALCRDYDIGLVASFCLHGGILTGKYSQPDSQPSRRFNAEQLDKLKETGLLERAAEYVQIATEAGLTPASLAYAYCLRHPNVASVLFGATSAEQISENLASLDALERIDDDLVAQLHALFPADGGFFG